MPKPIRIYQEVMNLTQPVGVRIKEKKILEGEFRIVE
jgi:hypothetical protein